MAAFAVSATSPGSNKMTSLFAAYSFILYIFVSTLFMITDLSPANAAELSKPAAAQGEMSLRETFRANTISTAQIAQAPSEAQSEQHLVIFFHGIRGRGDQFASIGRSWEKSFANTSFAYPDAPFPHRSRGRQWFTVDDQVMRADRIQAARQAFDDLVTDIVKREGFEGNLDNVAFVAVSQGAIMALDAVATGRWKVGALVSFAGMLPLAISSTSDTRILLIHGQADRTIPAAASVVASTQLKSAGFDVTLRLFADLGHTISSAGAQEASEFLRNHFDR